MTVHISWFMAPVLYLQSQQSWISDILLYSHQVIVFKLLWESPDGSIVSSSIALKMMVMVKKVVPKAVTHFNQVILLIMVFGSIWLPLSGKTVLERSWEGTRVGLCLSGWEILRGWTSLWRAKCLWFWQVGEWSGGRGKNALFSWRYPPKSRWFQGRRKKVDW